MMIYVSQRFFHILRKETCMKIFTILMISVAENVANHDICKGMYECMSMCGECVQRRLL